MKITTGDLRPLTKEEKIIYPIYNYVITNDWICEYEGKMITVKKGFLTDGASGGPDYGCSWIFHDWMYSVHKFDDETPVTRGEVDGLMSEILQSENIRWYMWLFHKLSYWNIFYLFSNAWETSGKRGPEFFKFEEEKEIVVEEKLNEEEIEIYSLPKELVEEPNKEVENEINELPIL